MTQYVKHDEYTLKKFEEAFLAAGGTLGGAKIVLKEMLNRGLLIRERVGEVPVFLSADVNVDVNSLETEPEEPQYVVWNPSEEKMAMRVMADFFGIVRMVKDHFPESDQKNDIIDSILYAQTSTLKMLVGVPA